MPKQLDTTEILNKTAPARWPAAMDRATLGEYLGVSLRTVDKMSSSDLPPSFRLGDSPRWLQRSVDAWLENKALE